MKRARRNAVALTVATVLTATGVLAGCSAAEGGTGSTTTLTYWASQQSPSVQQDRAILEPELKKFTQQTGIAVNLEVVPFKDLLNKLLTATTSGKGPDVANIGNTWTSSMEASGALVPWDAAALQRVGGAGRFEAAALATAGKDTAKPVSLPLYNKVYQLYYNKKLFAEAGIKRPPATWDEFVADGKKLTKDTNGDGAVDQWGLSLRGQASTNAVHYAFILGAARGARFFEGERATFDSPAAVQGIEQYLSWMGKDGIVNPSDAENADWAKVYQQFADGKAAMMLVQTLGSTLNEYQLTSKEVGVAPMPKLTGGAQDVGSFVGGTNVAIMASSRNADQSVELVKFLTSAPEQVTLNRAFGTVPGVTDAKDPAFDSDEMRIARETIATRAVPMPRVVKETQFESLIGKDVVQWLSEVATGSQPSVSEISQQLRDAGEKVNAG